MKNAVFSSFRITPFAYFLTSLSGGSPLWKPNMRGFYLKKWKSPTALWGFHQGVSTGKKLSIHLNLKQKGFIIDFQQIKAKSLT